MRFPPVVRWVCAHLIVRWTAPGTDTGQSRDDTDGHSSLFSGHDAHLLMIEWLIELPFRRCHSCAGRNPVSFAAFLDSCLRKGDKTARRFYQLAIQDSIGLGAAIQANGIVAT
jgi:hypothetical protein